MRRLSDEQIGQIRLEVAKSAIREIFQSLLFSSGPIALIVILPFMRHAIFYCCWILIGIVVSLSTSLWYPIPLTYEVEENEREMLTPVRAILVVTVHLIVIFLVMFLFRNQAH